MINSSFSAVYGALSGIRKLIHDEIASTFQTFGSNSGENGDTFTRSEES